jgi:hypothetical protein
VLRGFLLAVLAVFMLWAPSLAVASETLIGNSSSYTVASETEAGHIACERFVAAETGRVSTLFFKLDGVANTGVTKTVLGIESEGTSAPSGTVLGEGEEVATPSGFVTVSGLGVRVVYNTAYWLCWLPVGGALHYDVAVSSGGTAVEKSSAGSLTKLGSASWSSSADGPVYDYGLGVPFSVVELGEMSLGKIEPIVPELKVLRSVLESTLKVECSTCSSGSSTSVTASQFDSDVEALEVIGWCIVGVMLGSVVLYLWTSELRPK